jgi:hypothetical protein
MSIRFKVVFLILSNSSFSLAAVAFKENPVASRKRTEANLMFMMGYPVIVFVD